MHKLMEKEHDKMGGNRGGMKEFLVHVLYQHEQQTTIEKQRYPSQLSTTPAWGDRIVKGGLAKDNNNDSGISPDYCANTSSGSLKSFTADAAMSSPGSGTSQECNAVPSTNYDRSMQCSSPDEEPLDLELTDERQDRQEDSRERQNRQDCQPEHFEPQPPASIEQTGEGVPPVILECMRCNYVARDRNPFLEHLARPCAGSRTPNMRELVIAHLKLLQTPYTIQAYAECTEQVTKVNDENDMPRIDLQGKLKLHRCKRCKFIAATRNEFWDHKRTHIDPKKLLTCEKCRFVTDLNHHLLYHLARKMGSEPYKCDKCKYRCVNKSMLTSHMKSHSNVYPYKCATCVYRTKYLHSLKKHLKEKDDHQPAVVLNEDGTSNSIDVYGRRRGPKKKTNSENKSVNNSKSKSKDKSKNNSKGNLKGDSRGNLQDNSNDYSKDDSKDDSKDNSSENANAAQTNNDSQLNCAVSAETSVLLPQQPLIIPALVASILEANNENASDKKDENQSLSTYEQIIAALTCQLIFRDTGAAHPIRKDVHSVHMDHEETTAEDVFYNTPNADGVDSINQSTDDAYVGENVKFCPPIEEPVAQPSTLQSSTSQLLAAQSSIVQTAASPQLSTPQQSDTQEDKPALRLNVTPLDLRKAEINKQQPQQTTQEATSTPKVKGASRRKRKGKAVKLAHRLLQEDTDSETGQIEKAYKPSSLTPPPVSQEQGQNVQIFPRVQNSESEKNSQNSQASRNPQTSESFGDAQTVQNLPRVQNIQNERSNSNSNPDYYCRFCEITFHKEIMYKVHMGYHGFNEPYTCNKCGQKCTDSISFFLHMNHSCIGITV